MDAMTGRTLVVVRHAKAETYAAADRDRALTERGHADAADAGRHLAELGLVPDHAVVSSAVRAVETWEEVRRASGSQAEADVSETLYNASPDAALEVLRLVPGDVQVLAFVGHNPCAASLVHLLDDQEGDPALLEGLLEGFPPSAVAVFAVPGEWAQLDEATARLTHLHVGHG
jgi:phosphohistidine phosphatase